MNDLNTAYQDAKQIVVDSEDDDDIDTMSAKMAELFLMHLRLPSRKWETVVVDVHDDKRVAIDLRHSERIMSIFFNPKGFATYAYYDACSKHDESRGKFTFIDSIPFYIVALVNNVFEKGK